MSNNVKERTIEFVKAKGITMKHFEEKCNLSTGYVTSMRKGYGIEKLNNVLNAFPDLNRDWLLYGEGSMLRERQSEGQSNNSSASGNGVAVSGNNNQVNGAVSSAEAALLKEKVALLECLVEEKERLLAEKERTIQILLKK